METINKNIELLVSKPLSFEKVSSQLTKCRCYVVASGRNVNGSDITLEAIEKAEHTLYNMPLVANLKKKDDGSGWCVGSHDVEVVWNEDDELEINDLTVPFGVVPENCNAQIEEVLEPDGITKNSYLVVDVLLWSGRYNILDAAYSDDTYFNQSCEILVEKAHWDDDGYYVIEDFEFSALCLLGKSNDPKYNKRPCFPSCRVEKMKYSLDEDKFKQQFSLLMQEIKKTESVNSVQKNNKKEDDVNLDKNKKETLFSNVKAKIAQLMSETTYCDASTNKRYEKYKVLNISESDNAIIALDREENYSAYKIPYIVSYQADDSAIVTFDFQAKTAMKVGVTEDTDVVFNIKDEISIVAKDTAEYEIASYSNNHINYLTKQLTISEKVTILLRQKSAT